VNEERNLAMSGISKIIAILNDNPLLNLIFLLLACIGIIVSIVLFFASRKTKRPCFHFRTFKLIEDRINKVGDVEILYKGHRVDNISLTRVALWNRGKDTIDSSHVAKIDPIKIVSKNNNRFLSAEIIYCPVIANNFRIGMDNCGGEIAIEFDYFHKNEGVVIQIYHTGKTNDDMEMLGTVKGVRKLEHVVPGRDYYTELLIKYLEDVIGIKKIRSMLIRVPIMALTTILIFPIFVTLQFIDFIRNILFRVPQDIRSAIST